MKHYRRQNVYITATASERIVDTLKYFPHNSPMPQMSSTDRILMAAQDMTDALKHPHPEVSFATIGDNTIISLATLAEIFTRKFKKPETTNVPPAPQTPTANKRQDSQPQTVLTSPARQNHQTTSRTNINQSLENVQQPTRAVTPATVPASPQGVQARTHQLSP
jgi:hypothetical protein